jgi:glycosyltransferase involved in cell wall biosynthesis
VTPVGPGHPDVVDKPDLWVWVESGVGHEGLRLMIPQAVTTIGWFIDSHSQLWHKDAAPLFTHAFSAQRVPFASWLPVACDPDVHTPDAVEPTHDVVFVGHLYGNHPWYEPRRKALEGLAKRYNVGVYEGVYLHDMANAMATGRVAFNMSTLGDFNMRVFEAMCSGRPLVTDVVQGLDDLFADGKHLLTYTTGRELCAGIDYLLANPERAAEIGRAGRDEVLRAHTYVHRAEAMLACL